jgi:hypothetical protein
MASGLHDFFVNLQALTDGQAHEHQVSQIAAPNRARQASLPPIDAKTQNIRHFILTQPDLK